MRSVEQWTSKFGFVLATAGAAIGIGSIWKFPSVVATSGGGAFFFIFILFTYGIGVPLLLAEFLIGQSTGKEAVAAYRDLVPNRRYHWIGYLGVATCSLLLSVYSIVGSWIILYFIRALSGTLLVERRNYEQLFTDTVTNVWTVILAQAVFMLLTMLVVAKGAKQGIERVSRILMPSLFILFLILIIRALTLPGMGAGLMYFLKPDFSKLSATALLDALGQSFFCLCVGASCMVTYSSYLNQKEPLGKPAFSVAGLNVLTSLMAGISIFPALFALGVKPEEGPGLLFVALPLVFVQMPYGEVFIAIFLALFVFATVTSAFSLLEIVVAAFVQKQTAHRKRTCWICGFIIFILGVPAALSFQSKFQFVWLDKTVFDWVIFIVTNIMLPLGAIAISLFVGFCFPRKRLQVQWGNMPSYWQKGLSIYIFLLRYILPLLVSIVFLHGMNWLPI